MTLMTKRPPRMAIAKFLVPAETLNYPRTPMVTGEASGQSAVSRKGMETAKAWFRLNRLRADVFGFFNAFIFNAAHSTVKCNRRVKRPSGKPRLGFGSRVSCGGGS